MQVRRDDVSGRRYGALGVFLWTLLLRGGRQVPAVPVNLGRAAISLAELAGMKTDRLTVWSSRRRNSTVASLRHEPRIVVERGLEHEPTRCWVLAHEVAHLALGHDGSLSLRQRWALGAMAALGVVLVAMVTSTADAVGTPATA